MKWKNLTADTDTFFVTGTVTEWRPLFNHTEARRILLTDLDFYRHKFNCRIGAYVVMPDHYHLLLGLDEPGDLHAWLRAVQGHSGSDLSRWLKATGVEDELRVYREHARGKRRLAIWKEQARAVGITTEGVLRVKIEYIHSNPVRRGLVGSPADWPWSSWRNYHIGDDTVFRIDRFEIAGG